jgi:hypothetical protein
VELAPAVGVLLALQEEEEDLLVLRSSWMASRGFDEKR